MCLHLGLEVPVIVVPCRCNRDELHAVAWNTNVLSSVSEGQRSKVSSQMTWNQEVPSGDSRRRTPPLGFPISRGCPHFLVCDPSSIFKASNGRRGPSHIKYSDLFFHPSSLLRILVIPSGPLDYQDKIYLKFNWRHRTGTWTQQAGRAGTSWGQPWHLYAARREQKWGLLWRQRAKGQRTGFNRADTFGHAHAESLLYSRNCVKTVIFQKTNYIPPKLHFIKNNSVD